MIDREYIKFNTGIQTASNSNQLQTDEHGNVKAEIELRLPANLFPVASGGRKIDKVTMQTSKFRLSMENTPIAQIELDTDLETTTFKPTRCCLDVYPYCLLDNGQTAPASNDLGALAFPYYKQHYLHYYIYLYTSVNGGHAGHMVLLADHIVFANNASIYQLQKDFRFYDILQKLGYVNLNHILNMCAQSNHEPYKIEDGNLFIQNIGTLEQMFQDAIENAITFASFSDEIEIRVGIILESLLSSLDVSLYPDLDTKNRIYLEEYGEFACFFVKRTDVIHDQSVTDLIVACKPSVKISEQSITISYDTAPFWKCIPILWNTPFVNTFDHPEQMTIDKLRDFMYPVPPPKRVYRPGVNVSEISSSEDQLNFNFTLLKQMTCRAINIIANKYMKEAFSFLPWIECDLTQISGFQKTPVPQFNVKQESYNIESEHNSNTFDRAVLVTSYATGYAQNPKYLNGTADWPTELGSPPQNLPASYLLYAAYVPPSIQPDFTLNRHLFRNQRSYGLIRQCDVTTDYDTTAPHTTNRMSTDTSFYTLNGSEVIPEKTTDKTLVQNYNSYCTSETPPSTTGDQVITETRVPPSTVVNFEPGYEAGDTTNWYNYSFYGCRYPDNSLHWTLGYSPRGKWSDLQGYATWLPPQTPTLHRIQGSSGEQPNYVWIWSKPVDATDYNTYYVLSYLKSAIRVYNRTETDAYDIARHMVTTVTTNSSTSTDVQQYVTPNFPIDDDYKIYILDGTTAQLQIGNEEVIDGRQNMYKLYRSVDTETTPKKHENLYYLGFSPSNTTPEDEFTTTETEVTGDNFWFNHGRYPCITYQVYAADSSMSIITHHELYLAPYEESVVAPFYGTLRSSTEEATGPTTSTTVITNKSESNDITLNPEIQEIDWRSYEDHQNKSRIVSSAGIMNYLTMEEGMVELIDPTTFNVRMQQDYFPPFDSSLVSHYPDCVNQPQFIKDKHFGIPLKIPDEKTEPAPVTGSSEYFVEYSWFMPDFVHHPVEMRLPYSDPNKPAITIDKNYIWSHEYYFARCTTTFDSHEETTKDHIEVIEPKYVGNLRLNFTWNNLPIVVMSPIASIVLTLEGMQVTQEYQPVNITQPTGSSLVSTIPVIENFYSLAQTLRDLHDELVVTKDQFEDCALYTMPNVSGQERVIKFSAKYITKDGKLHQIYIPKNGVFLLQLTFGTQFYFTS